MRFFAVQSFAVCAAALRVQQFLSSQAHIFDKTASTERVGVHDEETTFRSTFQVVSSSSDLTKFTEKLMLFDDLVQELNRTSAHKHTLFVPTDAAFKQAFFMMPPLPPHFWRQVVLYHLTPGVLTLRDLFFEDTIATRLQVDELGGNSQRISSQVQPGGLLLNFEAGFVQPNMFTTNGVVHKLDRVLSLPPLPSERIKTQPLATQPNEFSTLEKAFNALDYWDTIDSTVGRTGGTLFAPTNDAFEKMGAETVDYLFNTDEGLAYLKAILDFHVIVNHTLFSNAYYAGSLEERFMESKPTSLSLPTLLGREIGVQVQKTWRRHLVTVNDQTDVKIADFILSNGVMHAVDSVLMPAKHESAGDGNRVHGMGFQEDLR